MTSKKKIARNPLIYQQFNCMNVIVEECCFKMYYWFGYMNEMNSQLNMNIDNKNLQIYQILLWLQKFTYDGKIFIKWYCQWDKQITYIDVRTFQKITYFKLYHIPNRKCLEKPIGFYRTCICKMPIWRMIRCCKIKMSLNLITF